MKETSEDDMHERRSGEGRGRHHRGWLLLIPAAVIIAKGARHRRAMRESGWGARWAGRGPHHHPVFGGGEGPTEVRGAFRLPPKIESMLDTWHTQAHQHQAETDPSVV
jgi:hypothetical protein